VAQDAAVRDTFYSPPCPRFASARAAFVDKAMRVLRADDRVQAAGLVGSLGRGNSDDWSDADLLFVVDDRYLDDFELADALPLADTAVLTFDARQNSPAGTVAISGQFLTEDLPLWVDWYVYPASLACWVSDGTIVFDRVGYPRVSDTFTEHLTSRELQPPTPKPPDSFAMMQLALVPIAGKRIARGSPDTVPMIEFLGAAAPADATPTAHIDALRDLLATYVGRGPTISIEASHRYLHLVAAAI
jgi:hypothetical protein